MSKLGQFLQQLSSDGSVQGSNENFVVHLTKAREKMLEATHTRHAPWTLVDFNDQKHGRLTLIRDLLDRLPDTRCDPPELDVPPLPKKPKKEKFDVLEPIKPFPLP